MTHHAATALFFTFGARSLYQSLVAWDGGGEELAEVEKELSESKDGKRSAKKRALGASYAGHAFASRFPHFLSPSRCCQASCRRC